MSWTGAKTKAVKGVSRAALTRTKEQRGVTLIETMIAMPIMLLVVGVALALLMSLAASQARSQGRAMTVIEQKNRLERITRELRQASHVESVPAGSWSTNAIKVTICVDYEACSTTKRTVQYTCVFTGCFRSVDGGPAVLFAERQQDQTLQNTFRLYWRSLSTGELQPDGVEPNAVTVTMKTAPNWKDSRYKQSAPLSIQQTVPLENLSAVGGHH